MNSRGGRGRSGRGRGSYSGRSNNFDNGGSRPANQSTPDHIKPVLNPCRNYTQTGTCPNPTCTFAHIISNYCRIDQTSSTLTASMTTQQIINQTTSSNNLHKRNSVGVTCMSLWPSTTDPNPKFFAGDTNGSWTLYGEPSTNFQKSFEFKQGKRVNCLVVCGSIMFVGYDSECSDAEVVTERGAQSLRHEHNKPPYNSTSSSSSSTKSSTDGSTTPPPINAAISPIAPHLSVGCLAAWDLTNPTASPKEFTLNAQYSPWASSSPITALCPLKNKNLELFILSGSEDGSIRCWSTSSFRNVFTLIGHCRPITSLLWTSGSPGLLWSSSMDCTIRIWDIATLLTNETPSPAGYSEAVDVSCKHVITPTTMDSNNAKRIGHQPSTHGVTQLIEMTYQKQLFVLSAGGDTRVSAWDEKATHLISESHSSAVRSILTVNDPGDNTLLIVGLERGNIFVRSLPDFTMLYSLDARYTVAHDDAVLCLSDGCTTGSNAADGGAGGATCGVKGSFYSGGRDGKILVWVVDKDFRNVVESKQH